MAAILDFQSEQFYSFFFFFYLQVSPMLPTKFESTGLSVQEKRKIDFQDGGHLGFLIGTIWAIFDLQVILMLPTKFQVNWFQVN